MIRSIIDRVLLYNRVLYLLIIHKWFKGGNYLKSVYLILAVFGFVVPYYFFLSFLLSNGFDLQLMFDGLFTNRISTFFMLDRVITAIVLLFYSCSESQWNNIKNWWIFLLRTLIIGLSFSFPLFLYVRENKY